MTETNYKNIYYYPKIRKPFHAKINKDGRAVLSKFFEHEQDAAQCVADFKGVRVNDLLNGYDGLKGKNLKEFLFSKPEAPKPLPPARPRVLRFVRLKPESREERVHSGNELLSQAY